MRTTAKAQKIDLFGKYSISMTEKNSKKEFWVSVDGKQVEGFYFESLEGALLMCLIENYLKEDDEGTKISFAKTILTMLNYKNRGKA